MNHITDWSDGDPSFSTYSREHQIGPVSGADEALAKLGIHDKPNEVYEESPDDLEILFDERTLHVNPKTGKVVEEGQKPRLFLRIANWLHLNRGKKAWTYAADTYAAALLFLATSGMFMIAGRKGLFGRGVVLVLVGIAIPVAYVTLAGP